MAKLKDILTNHTIIGLDTNPFIYLFERHPQYFPLVETLFEYLKSPGIQGITSVITLNLRTDFIELATNTDA